MRSRRKWLRGKDSNQRPPGYEPDELPTALPRDEMMLIDNTTRRRLCQAFFILCRTETILTRLRTILFGAFPRPNYGQDTAACVPTYLVGARKTGAAEKRQPIPERFSGDGSAPPRFLVAVNFALQAACFRNPPVLLRYVSSSQKIFALQIFFGSPVCLVFRFVLVAFFVACAWLRRPSAKRKGLWCGDSRTTMPKSRTCLCQAHATVPNG